MFECLLLIFAVIFIVELILLLDAKTSPHWSRHTTKPKEGSRALPGSHREGESDG